MTWVAIIALYAAVIWLSLSSSNERPSIKPDYVTKEECDAMIQKAATAVYKASYARVEQNMPHLMNGANARSL